MSEKNKKREDILLSARALFKEKGFHNTKMDDIALSAGVGKGTLYEYFKNKQEIFDETCIECVTIVREDIEKIGNMDVTFKDKLVLLFNEKQESLYLEDIAIDKIMAYKNVISERVVKTMFNHVSDIYSIIEKIVDQGKEEGVVIKNIPSDIIACSLVGTMSEYYRIRMDSKKYEINEKDIIFNLLFNGFGVK